MSEEAMRTWDRLTSDTTTIGTADDAAHPTTVNGEAFRVGFAYEDLTGRLASVTYPQIATGVAPRTVTYGYRADSGLPLSATLDGAPIWTADDYDGQGRLVAETLGNGTHTEYTYGEHDPRAHVPWLERIETTDPSGHALMDLSYTYDPNGNVLSRSEAVLGRSESYTYDGLSRLRTRTLSNSTTRPTTEHYDYDDLGNLTNNNGVTQRYSAVHPHGLVSTGGTCTTIDLSTHLTTRCTGVRQASSDDRGRVTQGPDFGVTDYTDFDLPRTMNDGGTSARFDYDAGGARVRKTELDSVTTYVHGLYERRQRAGAPSTHTWNVNVGGRTIAQATQSGATGFASTNYLHVDRNGSPTLVTDAPRAGTGPRGEHYEYSPFGTRTRLDAVTTGAGTVRGVHTIGIPPPPERPGFTGDDEDPEISAVNMRGRMYVPSIGRFITPDPVIGGRSRQAWNPYSYALNNPETLVDPSGFQERDPGDAGIDYSGYGYDAGGGGAGGPGGIGGVDQDAGAYDTRGTSTASAPTPTAPAPPAPHLDSVGGSGSAREGTARQATDALFSDQGAHRVGVRIFDTLLSGVPILDPRVDGAQAMQWLLAHAPSAEMASDAASRFYETWHNPGPGEAGPGTRAEQAIYAYVSRVSHASAASSAGDDRELDDVVADTVSGVWVFAASVMTGRIIGGVVADASAASTGADVALSEGEVAAITRAETVVATGTDASGGGAVAADAAETRASTPVGSRDAPMTVQPGTNAPATIAGREYSGHALDRMQERGIYPSVVEDVIAHGQPTLQANGNTMFVVQDIRVVTNDVGRVVTAFFRSP